MPKPNSPNLLDLKLEWKAMQCDDFMSETTKPCRFEGKKSADFGKCRKSFLCRFLLFPVVFMSFMTNCIFPPILTRFDVQNPEFLHFSTIKNLDFLFMRVASCHIMSKMNVEAVI